MGLFSPKKVQVRGRLLLPPPPDSGGWSLYYTLAFLPAKAGAALAPGVSLAQLPEKHVTATVALSTLVKNEYEVELPAGHYHVIAEGRLCEFEGSKLIVDSECFNEAPVSRAIEVGKSAVMLLNLAMKPPRTSAPAAAAPASGAEEAPEFVTLAWATDDRLSMHGAQPAPTFADELERLSAPVRAAFDEAVELGNAQRHADSFKAYERGLASLPADARSTLPNTVRELDIGRAKCLLALERPGDAAAVLGRHLSRGRAMPNLSRPLAVGFLGTFGEAFAALGRADQADRCMSLALSLIAARDPQLTDMISNHRTRCLLQLEKTAAPDVLLEILDKQAQYFGPPHTEWFGCSLRLDALVKQGRLPAARALGKQLLAHMRAEGASAELLADHGLQVMGIAPGPGTTPDLDWMSQASQRRLAEAAIGDELLKAGAAGDIAALERHSRSERGVNAAGSGFRTALQMAANAGHVEAVRWLLDHGAEVDATNVDSLSALLLAADHNHPEVVALLLERGASVDRQDALLKTALHRAAWPDYRDVVRLLLSHGASFTLTDISGQTPVTLACTEDVPEVVSMMLQAGADPNAAGGNAQTPLMYAAMEGKLRVVRVLLDAGADRTARDRFGLTALDWARQEGKADVVRLLGP